MRKAFLRKAERTPIPVIPLLPGKFLFPLAQRSTKFPRAKWFCRLCEYHCDNLAKVECHHSCFAHVNYRPCPVLGAHHGAAPPAADPDQGAGRHAAPAAAPQQEPPGLPQRAAPHRGEGAGALPQRHLLKAGRGQRGELSYRDKSFVLSIFINIFSTRSTTCCSSTCPAALSGCTDPRGAGSASKLLTSIWTSRLLPKRQIFIFNLFPQISADHKPHLALLKALEVLASCQEFHSVADEFTSKIPTIKFSTHNNLACELSLNNCQPFQTSSLLRDYWQLDSRVRTLGVAFRWDTQCFTFSYCAFVPTKV